MRPLSSLPKIAYSVTRLGGGQTSSGVSYPGGLDITTPVLSLQPGALKACLNFEVAQSGGYARIGGYERFDGRQSPSTAGYVVVQVASWINLPALGNILTQGSASGQVVAISNAPGAYYAALGNVSGTFNYTDPVYIGQSGELIVTSLNPQTITAANPLTISSTEAGIATVPTGAISALLNAQFTAASADVLRALITPVPGSGAVLDVFHMAFSGVDTVYAFRANAGGTAVNLYKSGAAGWIQIPFYNQISFTLGNTAIPVDGDTLTQGAVTAIVKRVVWASGTWGAATSAWGAGTAAGTFVIVTPSGGSFSPGPATLSGSGASVTLSGPQSAITMLPGGVYEHAKYNFSGQPNTRRVYGCDGVNKVYEFDGETLVPITTGLTQDSPAHLACHRNYLVVAQKGSIMGCAVGQPYKWQALDGAWEIAVGDTVNSMISVPGSQSTATLALFLNTNAGFLYGADPSTFNLVLFNNGIGGLARSAQNLFDTFVFDSLGVVTIKTTLNWGNFLPSTLTKNILPYIEQNRSKITCSTISRDKSQYRVFFSDGGALWITVINQQYLGAGIIQFPNPVNCCDEDNDTENSQVMYFGSNDGLGYVYQMDVGTSFDGGDIDAYFTPNWDPVKAPRILKRFRAASLEISGTGYAQINFGYRLDYGSSNTGQPGITAASSSFVAAPNWDAFTWDNFIWDGQTVAPTDVDMQGTAVNVQVTISSGTNYMPPYTIGSIIYHYNNRRGLRV